MTLVANLPQFVTGVIDTRLANLPPVSTTPAVPVAKFTASVFDTGGNCQRYP
jgi:hypothetical protein